MEFNSYFKHLIFVKFYSFFPCTTFWQSTLLRLGFFFWQCKKKKRILLATKLLESKIKRPYTISLIIMKQKAAAQQRFVDCGCQQNAFALLISDVTRSLWWLATLVAPKTASLHQPCSASTSIHDCNRMHLPPPPKVTLSNLLPHHCECPLQLSARSRNSASNTRDLSHYLDLPSVLFNKLCKHIDGYFNIIHWISLCDSNHDN